MSINPITIDALPDYSGLDEQNADNYYRAGRRRAFLSSEIVNPFEVSLKEFTGYSDEKRPDEEIEVPCELGDSRFVMKATPTTKRPGYKEVFEHIDSYLRTRLAEYKAGERPVGVFTIDGEPYVSANEVLARIEKAKKKVTSKGVKIEISDSPLAPLKVNSMVVPLGMDLSELNEGNANRYLEACAMSESYAGLISDFEEELLGLTGYNNGYVPEQTEHMFRQMGRHIFHVRSIPYEGVGYGKIIGALDKEPGKRKPETGGDLVLVTREIEVPRLKIYKTRHRDGDYLVRLNGFLKRIDELVKENTQKKLRQKPIIHYPLL